jgi:periplasmic divalent cation tolerance protein
MAEYIQVYTTLGKNGDAKTVAKAILEKRLAACVHILGPVRSMYWWKGEMEEDEEWLCVMKTRSDRYLKLEKALKAVHPYEEPEILAVPVIKGSRGYFAWMDGILER